jgi:hypothetical protein
MKYTPSWFCSIYAELICSFQCIIKGTIVDTIVNSEMFAPKVEEKKEEVPFDDSLDGI